MSEFLQIVAIIGEVILWVLDRSVDLLCASMLLFACMLPWRWGEIAALNEHRNIHWRELAFFSFILTMFDFVCVPLGLISFLSPLRINLYQLIDYRIDSFSCQFNLRYFFVYNFVCLICDIVIIVMAALTALSPLRFHKVGIVVYRFYSEKMTETNDVYATVLVQSFGTLVDILCLPFAFAVLFSPLRILNVGQFLVEACKIPRIKYEAGNMYLDFNRTLVNQGIGAILDWLSLVVLIPAVLSPLRTRNVLRAIYEILSNKSQREYYLFNENCLLYGMAGIVDMFTIPMGIMACISPIRAYGLYTAIKVINFNDLLCKIDVLNTMLVASMVLAVVDLLLFPCFLFSLISGTRSYVVMIESYSAVTKGHGITKYSTYLNDVWFWTAVSAMIDLSCIVPGILCASLIPTCWLSAFYGSAVIRHSLVPSEDDRNAAGYDPIVWYPLFSALRLHWIKQIPSAFADVFAIVFAIIALLSPLRHFSFRRAIYDELQESNYEAANPVSDNYNQDQQYAAPEIDSLPALVVVEPDANSPFMFTAESSQNKSNVTGEVQPYLSPAIRQFEIPKAVASTSQLPSVGTKSIRLFLLDEAIVNSEENNNFVVVVQRLPVETTLASIDEGLGIIKPGDVISVIEEVVGDGLFYKLNNRPGFVPLVLGATALWLDEAPITVQSQEASAPVLHPGEKAVSFEQEPIVIREDEATAPETSSAVPSQINQLSGVQPIDQDGQVVDVNDTLPTTSCYNRRKIHYVYNVQLRRLCLYFGAMAIIDAIMLPFLLPLWITYYRYAPVRQSLTQAGEWGLHEFYLVLRQFGFLCVDVILFPIFAVVFLSQIRWKPVYTSLLNDDFCSDTSLDTYGTVLASGILLFLDVLMIPFVAIALITMYRFKAIWGVWTRPHIFHESANFHIATFITTFQLIFDFGLVYPSAFLACILSPFRIATIYTIITKYWKKCYMQCMQPRLPAAAVIEIEQTQEENASSSSPITMNLALNAKDDVDSHNWQDVLLLPNWFWRSEILFVFKESLLDFIFMPCFLILLVTGWRAKYGLRIFRTVLGTSFHDKDFIRLQFLVQIALLMRDILFLIPLALLTVTLFRLPRVILALIAKLSGDAVDEDPALIVKSARFEFPDVGGPVLHAVVSLRSNGAGSGSDIESPNDQNSVPIGSESVRNNYSLAMQQSLLTNSNVVEIGTLKLSSKQHIELFASGNQFWRSVEQVFGGTVASVGRSFLPIRLDDSNVTIASINELIDQSSATGQQFELRIELNFKFLKSVKRTTILKNIQKLDPNAYMILQLDCLATSATTTDSAVKKTAILRLCPTVREFIAAISHVDDGQLPAQVFVDMPKRYKSGLGKDVIQNGDDVDNDSASLVNSFYLIVGLEFIQLVTDIFYTFLAFLVIVSPIRFYQLVIQLFESASYRAIRIGKCFAFVSCILISRPCLIFICFMFYLL